MKLDPTVPLGNIGMFIGTCVGIIVVAVSLQAQVSQNDKDVIRVGVETAAVMADVKRVDERVNIKTDALRQEIKGDLSEINRKLDRLIERDK